MAQPIEPVGSLKIGGNRIGVLASFECGFLGCGFMGGMVGLLQSFCASGCGLERLSVDSWSH